jgi:hypothetical protein
VLVVLVVSIAFAALVELVMFVVAFPAVGKTIGSIPMAVRFGANILQATHVRSLIILFFFGAGKMCSSQLTWRLSR